MEKSALLKGHNKANYSDQVPPHHRQVQCFPGPGLGSVGHLSLNQSRNISKNKKCLYKLLHTYSCLNSRAAVMFPILTSMLTYSGVIILVVHSSRSSQ